MAAENNKNSVKTITLPSEVENSKIWLNLSYFEQLFHLEHLIRKLIYIYLPTERSSKDVDFLAEL